MGICGDLSFILAFASVWAAALVASMHQVMMLLSNAIDVSKLRVPSTLQHAQELHQLLLVAMAKVK